MAKSISDELKDLKDWIEILGERLKEKLSEDMSDVKLLVLLVGLFFVVLLGGLVISSSESLYGPIFSKILPASQPTHVPTTLPVTVTPKITPKPTPTPVLTPVPIAGNTSKNITLPLNNTTMTSPTPTAYPRLGWDYGIGSITGPTVTPTPPATPTPEPSNGST